MRWRLWGTAVVVVAALGAAIGLAALTSDRPAIALEAHDASTDDPVLSGSDLLGAGAELGDGFEVPAGAWLAGRVFPDDAEDGWVAHLVTVDDPVETFDRVIDQARALGFPLSRSGGACFGEVSFPEYPDEGRASALLLDLEDPEFRVHEGARGPHELETVACSTAGRSRSGRYASVSAHGSPTASHLSLRVGPVPEHAVGDAVTDDGRDAGREDERVGTPADLDLPTFRRAPGVGGRFGPTDGARFDVVEGSEVVAAWTTRAGTGHIAAVVRVDGDPDTVFAGYWDQLSPGERFGIERAGDERVVRSGVDEAGGWKIALTMVVGQDGDPSWLLFEGIND